MLLPVSCEYIHVMNLPLPRTNYDTLAFPPGSTSSILMGLPPAWALLHPFTNPGSTNFSDTGPCDPSVDSRRPTHSAQSNPCSSSLEGTTARPMHPEMVPTVLPSFSHPLPHCYDKFPPLKLLHTNPLRIVSPA